MSLNLHLKDEEGKRRRKPAFTTYDMESTFIRLDEAFLYVGDNSSYQKRAIKVLSFQWIFYSFLTMGMPFLFQAPQFLCKKVNFDLILNIYIAFIA